MHTFRWSCKWEDVRRHTHTRARAHTLAARRVETDVRIHTGCHASGAGRVTTHTHTRTVTSGDWRENKHAPYYIQVGGRVTTHTHTHTHTCNRVQVDLHTHTHTHARVHEVGAWVWLGSKSSLGRQLNKRPFFETLSGTTCASWKALISL